ncbi:hypothetical protein ACIBL3_26410 [Kribbella sp. NPDC050124]|uniref:hypothetical protein n=1 Tax=Kribbella sp. NPDC050124 TaxID=3364114 RepID=UPI003796ACC6
MLAAWAAVLDRSIEQIAAASADARTFDRQLIISVSDVWDNNTHGFFAAAVTRGARRERLAADGFRWMAEFGADRHEWVREQVAAAGHPVQVPPSLWPDGVHYRDYRGLVFPTQLPLTAEVARELEADYDLSTARVRKLLVERAGLRGQLSLAVDRRFDPDWEDAPPAELDLRFKGVDDLRFDLDDSGGLVINEDLSLTIGRGGVLRASSGTAWIHDSSWHLSAAGQAADRRNPPAVPRSEPPEVRRIRETAAVLAMSLVKAAMLEIRMVRYAHLADAMPVRRLAQAFSGAGAAVVAAGAHRWRRNAAFRRLIEQWIAAGGNELAPWFDETLRSIADDEWPSPSVRRLARDLRPRSAATGPDEVHRAVVDSEVVLVAYAAESPPHPISVVVQRAVLQGADWVLMGSEVEWPEQFGVVVRGGGLTVSGLVEP